MWAVLLSAARILCTAWGMCRMLTRRLARRLSVNVLSVDTPVMMPPATVRLKEMSFDL